MNRKLTIEQAEKIWDAIVEHAGANDHFYAKSEFVHAVARSAEHCSEWRFVGSLGFGGKFRNNGNNDNTPHVDCYPEDETPERRAVIENTNAAIKLIVDKT